MKITRRQLRKLINEALDPIKVKTVKPEFNQMYNVN